MAKLDRITKALTKSTPTFDDIAYAASRNDPWSKTQTYGNILNALLARQKKDAQDLYTAERQADADVRSDVRLDLQRAAGGRAATRLASDLNQRGLDNTYRGKKFKADEDYRGKKLKADEDYRDSRLGLDRAAGSRAERRLTYQETKAAQDAARRTGEKLDAKKQNLTKYINAKIKDLPLADQAKARKYLNKERQQALEVSNGEMPLTFQDVDLFYDEFLAANPAIKPTKKTGRSTISIPLSIIVDGKQRQGRYSRESDDYEYKNEKGVWAKAPHEARVVPRGGFDRSRVMTIGDFRKLATTVSDDQNAIGAIQSYWADRKDGPQGWKVLVNNFTHAAKTFLGDTNLSLEEAQQRIASGKLKGLVGRFRKEVVGGGVMTEQDFFRVLLALGGEVDSLQNRHVVGALLHEILTRKLHSHATNVRLYNEQLEVTGRVGWKPATVPDIKDILPMWYPEPLPHQINILRQHATGAQGAEAIKQFEQRFGPGSSRQFLGQK